MHGSYSGAALPAALTRSPADGRSNYTIALTVSNGAHLGATIGRVHAWQKQLDEGGSDGWSKAFMPDRFHADAEGLERVMAPVMRVHQPQTIARR